MYYFDLKDSTYSSYYLPPQAIPNKRKDDRWKKECMDALEHIGMRYMGKYRYHFEKNYRIVDGDFKYHDITDSSAFLSEVDYWRSQAPIKDEIKHYGFIEPIIRQLVTEFQKQPDSVIVSANDNLSTNDYIRTKTDMLWGGVNNDLMFEIENKIVKMGIDPYKQDFSNQQEYEQHVQQLEQLKAEMTPPEVEKYMNQNYKAVYVEWAEVILEADKARFAMDEIDRDCMVDYLTTGRCFRHHRIGYDYYLPERWSPKNTFTSCIPENRYVEDDEYVGRIHYFTPTEIINYFGHKLSEVQKRDITKSNYYSKTDFNRTRASSISSTKQWVEQGGGTLDYVPFPAYYPYENAKWLQEYTGVDLGVSDLFPNGKQYGYNYQTHFDYDIRHDLVRTVEAYWVSQMRVGYLTLPDENGKPRTEIVTDDVLRDFIKEYKIKQLKTISLQQHQMNPENFTIVWDYLPQVYYGVKICRENTDLAEDLYLDVEPIEYQLKGESELYNVKLPVTGIVDKVALVDLVYERQVSYNIAMNMARDYMSKELGVFWVMDFTFLPSWMKKMGGEEAIAKLMDVIKELGVLPLDATNQNTRSNFNQFTSVNMDLTQAMLGKFQYAQMVKQEAFSLLGLSPERIAMPIEQETATGVQASLDASYAQTDTWFDKFAKHQQRTYEMHLNIAQYAKSTDKDVTVDYTDSDKHRHFLRITDPYLPMRRFRIYLENNAKRRGELETLKQVFLNDNTIPKDLELVAEVITSDSISKVLTLGRISRRQVEIQQEQARLHELQKQQQDIQAQAMEKQADRNFEAEQNRLEREFELNKQAILALGFDEDKDRDNNQVADVIDAVREATNRLKMEADIAHKNQIQSDNRLQQERDHGLKQRELQLKDKEINVRKHTADVGLQIARENKYKHEVKK